MASGEGCGTRRSLASTPDNHPPAGGVCLCGQAPPAVGPPRRVRLATRRDGLPTRPAGLGVRTAGQAPARAAQAVAFGSFSRPEEDADDVEPGQVDGGGLLVAADDASPLLQTADAPFDGVALLVGGGVEGRWSAAASSSSWSVSVPVVGDGEHCAGAALAQVLADRSGGGRRVRRTNVRLGARTATLWGKHARVSRGTRTRVATSVQAGASSACPVVRTNAGGRRPASAARWILVVGPPRDRPVAWSCGSSVAPFARAPAACRWVRTTLESAETAQAAGGLPGSTTR